MTARNILIALVLVAFVQVSVFASGLPVGLTELVHQVEATEFEYPERARDLRSLKSYIANGDFDMAAHKAGNIIKQQKNLILAKKNGLPAQLTELIRAVEATESEYPERARDLRSLKSYMANGDFDMAAHKARNIIKQQKALRSSPQSLPAQLTELIREIEATESEYPERARDLRSLTSYIANGDFDMAAHKAGNIIKQQKNLILAKKNSLPAQLTELIRAVEATESEYPERARDLRSLKSYIANGDFDMAAHKAGNIIKQQKNLILAKKNGLPAQLTELIRAVEATESGYPERARDLRSLKSYIANGDFDMAAHKAKSIIKQQRNIR